MRDDKLAPDLLPVAPGTPIFVIIYSVPGHYTGACIIAQSENALIKTWTRVAQRWAGQCYVKESFVGTTAELSAETLGHLLEHNRLSDMRRVAASSRDFIENLWRQRLYPLPKFDLPAGLRHCSKFEQDEQIELDSERWPNYTMRPTGQEPNSWPSAARHPSSCECLGVGIMPVKGTWETEWTRYEKLLHSDAARRLGARTCSW